MSKYKNALINPYEIPEEKLPCVVLSDDRQGLFGFLIKQHCAGNYNHAMELCTPGYFASQDPTGYNKIHISKYQKPYIILKFWHYKPATPLLRLKWMDMVDKELNAPKSAKDYDFLGILGQMLHLPWLNNPAHKYCSERVAEHLIALGLDFPKHPTPSELNTLFNKSEDWECLGYWIAD